MNIQHVLYRQVPRSERRKNFIGPRQPEMLIVYRVGPPTREEFQRHRDGISALISLLVDVTMRRLREESQG